MCKRCFIVYSFNNDLNSASEQINAKLYVNASVKYNNPKFRHKHKIKQQKKINQKSSYYSSLNAFNKIKERSTRRFYYLTVSFGSITVVKIELQVSN